MQVSSFCLYKKRLIAKGSETITLLPKYQHTPHIVKYNAEYFNKKYDTEQTTSCNTMTLNVSLNRFRYLHLYTFLRGSTQGNSP